MDIVAHGLWAGMGASIYRSKRSLSRGAFCAVIGATILPDILHAVPVAIWAIGQGDLGTFVAYALATPGAEPSLPTWLNAVSHHLHCAAHSILFAGVATAISAKYMFQALVPLSGWWLHVVLDAATHSADFYPAPILYPVTYQGLNGIAWNTPLFLWANYSLLLLAYLWIAIRRPRIL